MFDAVIELDGGFGEGEEGEDREEPRWTIVKDVGGVVDELLAAGVVYRPEIRTTMPLGDGDDDGCSVFDEVRPSSQGDAYSCVIQPQNKLGAIVCLFVCGAPTTAATVVPPIRLFVRTNDGVRTVGRSVSKKKVQSKSLVRVKTATENLPATASFDIIPCCLSPVPAASLVFCCLLATNRRGAMTSSPITTTGSEITPVVGHAHRPHHRLGVRRSCKRLLVTIRIGGCGEEGPAE